MQLEIKAQDNLILSSLYLLEPDFDELGGDMADIFSSAWDD